MNEEQVVQFMTSNGFTESRRTKKVVEFVSRKNRKVLYFECKVGLPSSAKMILHPDERLSAFSNISGVDLDASGPVHHHSNMTAFPKRKNTGANPIPYGRPLRIEGIAAFPAFAEAFHGL